MNTRGGEAPPPPNGGEFLLQLLRNAPNSTPPAPAPSQTLSQDPAVAAVGPAIPTFPLTHSAFPPNGYDFSYSPWQYQSPSPPFVSRNHFQQNPNMNFNSNPDFSSPPRVFGHTTHRLNSQSNYIPVGEDVINLGSFGGNSKPNVANQEQHLIFGSIGHDTLRNEGGDIFRHQKNKSENSYPDEGLRRGRFPPAIPVEINKNAIRNAAYPRALEQESSSSSSSNSNNWRKQVNNGSHSAVAPPPGFSSKIQDVRNSEIEYRRVSDLDVDKGKSNFGDFYKNDRLIKQLESPGLLNGSILESMMNLHSEDSKNSEKLRHVGQDTASKHQLRTDMDDLEDKLVSSLGLEKESEEKIEKKKHHRDKDYRADKRGQWIMGQRMRNLRRLTTCRSDIKRFDSPFLAVFESLIPSEEEKTKQKQLLMVLEKLVAKEWPEARLYLYGSCANSFGFSKSDIDVCLAMESGNIDKAEVLLKLAEILKSDNLQNVQAIIHARVPIVKLMDPVTGIACDICINNMLAVVNTKLLRDYACIDARLQQLAFIVKHWAKTRGVNETYQGTLSSYAYVLMCIHFLQQRRPPILPCLQELDATYFATVDSVKYSYFDRVDKLQNFGSQNRESISQLVWSFFHYWAYCHDYANDVISVRCGNTLSKRSKDWTRRVGNDRHLICIEDPFEVSHDLGRVVDKFSIRVLREEFERAADVLQHDPNPCATLFQPYVPE